LGEWFGWIKLYPKTKVNELSAVEYCVGMKKGMMRKAVKEQRRKEGGRVIL
jgi:hypothetical protein